MKRVVFFICCFFVSLNIFSDDFDWFNDIILIKNGEDLALEIIATGLNAFLSKHSGDYELHGNQYYIKSSGIVLIPDMPKKGDITVSYRLSSNGGLKAISVKQNEMKQYYRSVLTDTDILMDVVEFSGLIPFELGSQLKMHPVQLLGINKLAFIILNGLPGGTQFSLMYQK